MMMPKWVHGEQRSNVKPWESAMSGEILRKASKDLMPSESPFFSPKALSSSPWSAKPFMRTPYAHRAFGVMRNAYNSDINRLNEKYIISKMTARLFFDIGAQPYESRRAQPCCNLGAELILHRPRSIYHGIQTSQSGLCIPVLRKQCTFRSLHIH